MKIECTCGQWHAMTPTALVAVVLAFQDGDLQRVKRGVEPLCILGALTPDRIERMQFRYPGRRLNIDPVGEAV
jgi:hypothetical protein